MTVIAITGETDLHSLEVMSCLRAKGVDTFLLDFSKFPRDLEIGFRQGVVIRSGDTTITQGQIQSVLYRRPSMPQVASQDPCIREYVERESQFFLDALPHIILVPWVSDPDAVRIAMRKPYQLIVARRLGFHIPETIFGNSQEAVEQFISSRDGEFAAKAVHRTYIRVDEEKGPLGVYTQRLTREQVQRRLDRVRYCPLIFQEYVPKEFELRVTVVGSQVFTCAIHSQQNERTKVDWRNYDIPNTPHEVYKLPDRVSDLCIALVQQLGLMFGAIDMVVTPDGEYVFLEINPVGQWLWIEELTKLPITSSIADLLIDEKG
ncbi:MAG: hypothetical protein A3H01_00535 [Candidatus Wildermuthbacteria bacterium RIFCSPLOWO2_12_FULL_40_9]|uniref:ATP-grasp domain-containing protein n=1 Tax=Candidatus Wildermuthbacteria bacterium RIFCSPLOWO2_12_FULL_40_9 TaxID=1802467 RepID=A0A1G2RYY7_9BACT|nr:MAG: hypothetical protein A3H01_00535 [Candidatus Wildermuthbacteria bacterium RIFCSPLOWO2_12_FULL_40_9]